MKNSDFYDYLQIIVLIFLVSYLIYPLFAIGFLIVCIIINVSISLTCKFQKNQILQQIQYENQEYFKTNQNSLPNKSKQDNKTTTTPLVVTSENNKTTPLVVTSENNKTTPLVVTSENNKTTPLSVTSEHNKTAPLSVTSDQPFNLMNIIDNFNSVQNPHMYERNNLTNIPIQEDISREKAMEHWMQAQIAQRGIYPSPSELYNFSRRENPNFMGY